MKKSKVRCRRQFLGIVEGFSGKEVKDFTEEDFHKGLDLPPFVKVTGWYWEKDAGDPVYPDLILNLETENENWPEGFVVLTFETGLSRNGGNAPYRLKSVGDEGTERQVKAWPRR